ncbi:hypothetical protein GRB29_09140 [Streptococcus pneumoniae]|nr:hypothetical protein [Streptococcus pneumoniae]
MKYLVTRNVIVKTKSGEQRFVLGQTVQLKKRAAERLNKKAGEPFLELIKEEAE